MIEIAGIPLSAEYRVGVGADRIFAIISVIFNEISNQPPAGPPATVWLNTSDKI